MEMSRLPPAINGVEDAKTRWYLITNATPASSLVSLVFPN